SRQAANPPFHVTGRGTTFSNGVAALGRDGQQVFVKAQELGERAQRRREIPKTRGDRRLDGVVVQEFTLRAGQPAQVQRTQVAAGQFGAERDQRRHPAFGLFVLDPAGALLVLGV